MVCGQTGCGKSVFVLDVLEKEYQGVFENIDIHCPTVEWNKAYKTRSWIGDVRRPKDKSIIIVNPVLPDGTEKLQELLRLFLIDLLGAQRCISSMTALPRNSSPRKKTCCHSWHFLVGIFWLGLSWFNWWVSFAPEFQCCYFCESSCLFYLSFNFDFYVSKIMHL